MDKFWIKYLPVFIQDRLNEQPSLLRIFANFGWLSFDRILRMGVGLFVGIWIARYLGPEQFGFLSYALAFVALFSAISTLGLDNIIIRDIINDSDFKYEILGTAFILKLLGSGAVVCLALMSINMLRPGDNLTQWSVGIIALGSVFQSFNVIDFWFQSQIQSKYTIWAKNPAFLLATLTRVMLILLKAPLMAFVIAICGEIVFEAIGLVAIYLIRGQQFKHWQFKSSRAKQLLKTSWPLMLSGMAIMLYMKIDVIMLGEMVGDRAVGIYAAATRISELWYFIPMAIISSVLPLIIEAKKVSEAEYYNRMQQLFDLMTGLALIVAIPMTFFSNSIISFLYKENFAGAGPILAIHIWAALFVFWGVAQSPWDVTEGLTKLVMKRTILGVIVNVVLNAFLLPLYAGLGAAIATVAAYAVSSCFANLIDSRSRQIFVLQIKSLIVVKHFNHRR